jgi:hypothetical protein
MSPLHGEIRELIILAPVGYVVGLLATVPATDEHR